MLLLNNNSYKVIKATKAKENKKDVGTCLNCKYQGLGSNACNKCKRNYKYTFYKLPADVADNFKLF